MSVSNRIPGPVEDEATPIKNPNYVEGGDSPKSDRTPGEISEPSERIVEEEKLLVEDELVETELLESSPWKLVFWLFGITFSLWLLFEVVISLIELFWESVWLGIPATVLVVSLLIVLGWAIKRELSAIRGVDKLAERKKKISKAIVSNDLFGLRDTLEPTLKNLRIRRPKLIGEFEEAASQRETAEEYFKQFDNIVLTQLDKEANAVIKQSVLTGSVAVMVMPHPALDAVVVLWRAKVLIQKIGEIYGLEPSGLSSLKLMKHAVMSAVIAASIDELGSLMAAQMSQDMFAKSIKSLGEGAATAMRLYRLGIMAQKFCKPVSL